MTEPTTEAAQRLNGSYLLLGGARSGKSDLALNMALASELPVQFVATAEAHDADMARRIERHREERPAHWTSAELPLLGASDVAELNASGGAGSLLVVDCLTMLVSNLYLRESSPSGVDAEGGASDRTAGLLAHVEQLADALSGRDGPTIVVTNEVGMGVVPATEMGREYRDLLGRANRTMAQRVDHPLLVVAGCTLELNNGTPHL